MNVRDALVRSGVELLERDGLEALTQRQIASHAGVSHGAPRHHFPTYASLLAGIARVGIDDLDRLITRGLQGPDARSAIVETCESVLDFAVTRPAMFDLVSRHDLLEGGGERLRDTTGLWVTALGERVRELRPDADLSRVLALWSGVHGLGVMFGRRSAAAITAQEVEPKDVLISLVDSVLGDG